jgi:Mg2+-importing ATPase
MERLNGDGFRVVAVACKAIAAPKPAYEAADETGLTLLGYIAFLDPPKDSAAGAIQALARSGVGIKILTGDNDAITRTVCRQVGLTADRIVLGSEIAAMTNAELGEVAERASVFAKLAPAQKARVIQALRGSGHVVGFMATASTTDRRSRERTSASPSTQRRTSPRSPRTSSCSRRAPPCFARNLRHLTRLAGN